MFKNWLHHQTPIWLIIPVFVVGAILDYRLAYQKSKPTAQVVSPSESEPTANSGD